MLNQVLAEVMREYVSNEKAKRGITEKEVEVEKSEEAAKMLVGDGRSCQQKKFVRYRKQRRSAKNSGKKSPRNTTK